MFIDEFLRNKSSDPTVAGRGVALAVFRNDDNRSKRGKGKKPWKKNCGGVRSSKWCSVHKSTNHSVAECRKQKEENKNPTAPPAQANFAHVGTSFYLRIPVRRTLRSA